MTDDPTALARNLVRHNTEHDNTEHDNTDRDGHPATPPDLDPAAARLLDDVLAEANAVPGSVTVEPGGAAGCSIAGCSCNTPASPEHLRAQIDHHGWMIFVARPGHAHTIGLTVHDLPELVLVGPHTRSGTTLLNTMAALALERRELFTPGNNFALTPPEQLGMGIQTLTITLRAADPVRYAIAAIGMYGAEVVRLLEIVLPDESHGT